MTFELTLTFMSGNRDGDTLRLLLDGSPPGISIGRLAENDLSLPDDPEVSRRHARLYWDGELWLQDSGSANGCFTGEFKAATRVNGNARIAKGTIVRIGLTRFRVDFEHKFESYDETRIGAISHR